MPIVSFFSLQNRCGMKQTCLHLKKRVCLRINGSCQSWSSIHIHQKSFIWNNVRGKIKIETLFDFGVLFLGFGSGNPEVQLGRREKSMAEIWWAHLLASNCLGSLWWLFRSVWLNWIWIQIIRLGRLQQRRKSSWSCFAEDQLLLKFKITYFVTNLTCLEM